MFKKVDFPEPDGPTKAIRSPFLILRSIFLKISMTPFL